MSRDILSSLRRISRRLEKLNNRPRKEDRMKEVTLYRIVKDDYPSVVDNYIEWRKHGQGAPFLLKDGDSIHEISRELIRSPVEIIEEWHTDPKTEKVAKKEWYIAVDPQLKDLLTRDYQQKIERISNSYEAVKEDLNITKDTLDYLRDDIEDWWGRPWYKRMWDALRHKRGRNEWHSF